MREEQVKLVVTTRGQRQQRAMPSCGAIRDERYLPMLKGLQTGSVTTLSPATKVWRQHDRGKSTPETREQETRRRETVSGVNPPCSRKCTGLSSRAATKLSPDQLLSDGSISISHYAPKNRSDELDQSNQIKPKKKRLKK